ncbi:hypothetical protein NTG1052_440028 [Candidatus Nitrotoga sp. 1052]|nr:hypothetical protein NTG1052_440028 [Candidatus Nitrotoga sp. 1052]
MLAADGFKSQAHEKAKRGRPLSDEWKASNRTNLRPKCEWNTCSWTQNAMGGHIVRTIGMVCAKVKIGMMNLVSDEKNNRKYSQHNR